MSAHYQALTDQFEAHELEGGCFSHADHVGVAYEMLARYEFLDAAVRYAKGIDVLATRAGAADKFNLTITLAFLSLIAERRQTVVHDNYEDFLAKNPDLLDSSVIRQWYPGDRAGGALARRIFLLPKVAAA